MGSFIFNIHSIPKDNSVYMPKDNSVYNLLDTLKKGCYNVRKHLQEEEFMNMEQIAQLRALVSEETPDVQAFAKLSRRVRTETEGLPETERKARFLETLASELPTPVFAGERLLGSMRFWSNVHLQPSAFFNMGHIVVDYGSVLEIGLQKLAEKLDARNTEDSLFSARAVRALSKLILRYAKAANETAQEAAAICRRIASHAPETFHEALQLLWFIHLFLHAEGMSAAISFGRFDMYMYPYYRKDMEAGKLNREAAMDLLACLWLKTCEGDESQNLTLGGEGENELSCLCLEVSRWIQTKQPSLSARIGKHTSGEFMAEVIRLIKSGLGMPAIFNDPVVESALTQLGIPAEEAHDYAIVGCYEANPPQALGLTVAGAMQLHRGLLDWLPVAKHDDFDTFLQDYKDYFVRRYLETELPGFVKVWETVQARMVSPFESACISACVNSGLAAEHKGAKYTMFGINILGLGTLTDSLYAVKKLVFEGGMDYDTFVGQVLQNFPDLSLSEKCKSLPGKYGTDNPETNALAQTLSAHIARTVMQNRFDADIICYPRPFPIYRRYLFRRLPGHA